MTSIMTEFETSAFKAKPTPTYGLIGDGRVARHMRHYLQLTGHSFFTWNRSQSEADLRKLQGASIILLLIKDESIEPFYKENDFLHSKTCLHFSGSQTVHEVPGFHPLFSFGEKLYSLRTYEKIPFICEAGGALFEEAFPRLNNPHFDLQVKDKELYHSLCVMAGNFSTVLWNKLFEDFESKLGLDREVAIPYLERITKNLKTNPKGALTGPLVRKDQKTIEANLKALQGDKYQDIYKAFVELMK